MSGSHELVNTIAPSSNKNITKIKQSYIYLIPTTWALVILKSACELVAPYWLEWSFGSFVAALPSNPPVLPARFNATTTSGDSPFNIVNLHVAGVQRPLRALLDSEATNNFFRESCAAS